MVRWGFYFEAELIWPMQMFNPLNLSPPDAPTAASIERWVGRLVAILVVTDYGIGSVPN